MEITKDLILLNKQNFMGNEVKDFVRVYIAQMDGFSTKYFIENVGSLDEISSERFNKMLEDTRNYLKK
jgi:hypothetical protein